VFSRRRRRHAVTDAAPFILTACGQDERQDQLPKTACHAFRQAVLGQAESF